MDAVKQDSTSLGKFDKWDNNNNNNNNKDDNDNDDLKYKIMMFNNGQKCWNGPNRSCMVIYISMHSISYRLLTLTTNTPNTHYYHTNITYY